MEKKRDGMQVGNKDMPAILAMQVVEIGLRTAASHWLGKAKVLPYEDDTIKLAASLAQMHDIIAEYNDILSGKAKQAVRPDIEDKFGDMVLIIMELLEHGIEQYSVVKDALKKLKYSME